MKIGIKTRKNNLTMLRSHKIYKRNVVTLIRYYDYMQKHI